MVEASKSKEQKSRDIKESPEYKRYEKFEKTPEFQRKYKDLNLNSAEDLRKIRDAENPVGRITHIEFDHDYKSVSLTKLQIGQALAAQDRQNKINKQIAENTKQEPEHECAVQEKYKPLLHKRESSKEFEKKMNQPSVKRTTYRGYYNPR